MWPSVSLMCSRYAWLPRRVKGFKDALLPCPVPLRTHTLISLEKTRRYQDCFRMWKATSDEDCKPDAPSFHLELGASHRSNVCILCDSQVCVPVLSEGAGWRQPAGPLCDSSQIGEEACGTDSCRYMSPPCLQPTCIRKSRWWASAPRYVTKYSVCQGYGDSVTINDTRSVELKLVRMTY